MSSGTSRHITWTQSYRDRAATAPPLAAYLLRLITIKKSNLCFSADVSTTAELLSIAEEVGDSICLLKTHADIVNDFSDRTVKGLREIARRKRFIIFEDRKFADIGETVQKQYTAGPLSIAKWAEITNAHILPGPAIVTALEEAAARAIATYNSAVHTEISVGTPETYTASENDSPIPRASLSGPVELDKIDKLDAQLQHVDRKQSIVSISTTISQQTDPISPQAIPNFDAEGDQDIVEMFNRLGNPPYLRSLLLLAEMSSEGHLLTSEYSARCVEIAREHKEFVIGFIAQRSLNTQDGDNFLTMTPGVKLPPPGKTVDGRMGDGKGQQYNTPRKIIYEQGADIIIVGRGIITAQDPHREAERYRKEAWKAYQERVGAKAFK
ncbi:orotidine-5'-phosphate decarboxylase [Patellaria atrata CBS 101060]|uniref:Orotidine 5'-phosphate decarboxylase n=1 Tax=Patellaria atrata CBS 101060 TaxID=1346257 RepID=A0A9P4SL15_9PEZI|nr:orotidine-5'-phosphate decarboxylase [Patellaria atrata CBS 101060]